MTESVLYFVKWVRGKKNTVLLLRSTNKAGVYYIITENSINVPFDNRDNYCKAKKMFQEVCKKYKGSGT